MPYDPAKPAFGAPDSSEEMRGQLNGLKDIINAGAVTGVAVDAVNTVPAGQPANVSLSLVAGVLHMSFDIPQGPGGSGGSDGAPGATGPPGELTNAALTAG